MVRFWESEKSLEKRIPSERAPQEENNGANFSFIAPSSEEYECRKQMVKTTDCFGQRLIRSKRIPSERAPQEEQNETNFRTLTHVVGFHLQDETVGEMTAQPPVAPHRCTAESAERCCLPHTHTHTHTHMSSHDRGEADIANSPRRLTTIIPTTKISMPVFTVTNTSRTHGT